MTQDSDKNDILPDVVDDPTQWDDATLLSVLNDHNITYDKTSIKVVISNRATMRGDRLEQRKTGIYYIKKVTKRHKFL